ncbi:uncharacterized protein LOC144112813 [Amblyomma americanum]
MPCAFQDLVFLLQEHVVLVFKILQLHYDDPHKVRFEDRRRRHLNRRLTATMKRLSGVHVLNHEHRFLDASGEPMLSLFAADRGIDQMSKIIVAALVKIYGPGIASASRARPGEVYVVHRCRRCGAKGHKTDHCWAYCSPPRRCRSRLKCSCKRPFLGPPHCFLADRERPVSCPYSLSVEIDARHQNRVV